MLNKGSFFVEVWRVVPSAVVWGIWLNRNKKIFRKESMSLENVCEKIETSIAEALNAYTI